uniref:Intersectin-2-like n=1 Tax=Sinocyclocheilus anshuiensis TaxID=1608454 RepID=A0A671LB09_9TELE
MMAFFRILALNKISFTFSVPVIVAGGFNIWAITPEERGKHDKQFDSLAPTLGYLSGDQARKFFLQSGLATAVLADIWALADIGKDGKMDRLEFSIAMKLIKLQLQGQPLPSSLPIIMKQTPTPAMTPSSRFGMGSMPNLSAMSVMPILTPIPTAPAMTPLVPVPTLMSGPLPQMPSSLSVPALPNGNATLLTPTPGTVTPSILNSLSSGLSKSHSLLDLVSSSSNSSSTTSLASNSPKMNASDWAVPQSSRLKYRQQFNSLDKLMSGYLSGPQVRNALTASNLTQTQLATIWALADVDRDGQLRAEEFILAMHLVDMAKTGRPLPLTLPPDLVPPSLRQAKSCDLLNGPVPSINTELIESEHPQKKSFEDKFKENFQRGNAELEKRRLALREEERREEERRRQKEREEREQKEREALEMELRRQREEERRIERQRELERQREEERLKELERQETVHLLINLSFSLSLSQEAERQRRMEWEKSKQVELQTQREKEQSDIQRLKDRKRSLEIELEAVGNKHKQISDRLRDAKSKRQIPRTELDLINQKRDSRITDINSLQLQFEVSDCVGFLSGLQPVVTTEATCAALTTYRALYPFTARNSDELTLEADCLIEVDESTVRETGWLYGSYRGNSGWFPESYAERCKAKMKSGCFTFEILFICHLHWSSEIAQVTTANAAKTPEQLSLTPGQLIVVLYKNSNSWWLGELQARGKKRKKGWFHSSNVRLLEANSGKITPASQPLCQVIAMYDYKAANKDEMSFQKGQLITVLNKDNPDWWKGEVAGVIGLFPTNYVKMTTECDPSQQWCADLLSLDSMCTEERKRQGYIHELIQTEESYLEDLELALEVFYKPMAESGRLTEAEMSMIFVSWRELIMCSTKLLKALPVRKKMAGERMPVQVVGDILSSELSHMQAYIRFCSCQLNAAALLQQKTDKSPDFKLFLKKIASNYRCKGMPLSSFLLKPMQRITRYPLLIKNILENTPSTHADHANLQAALEQAEELCSQVNEGVREKENSDRLEWIQNHVLCDGVIEHLVFNSLTNCLGPRKLLHSGKLHKTKSSKELWAFLFNDFLLLTYTSKQFSSGPDKLFNPNSNAQYKMYKTPVFLNEVLVKMPSDPSSDDPVFHISHIDRVYTLKADTINERTTWVQKIKAASDHFIETGKLKREKAYQARSQKNSGIGRLLVTVLEATELKPCKPNGKSNPYCELTMGAQCYTSRHQPDTLNPKWNFNCHFFIKDLYQDVFCLTIFERDQFSPDDFLGRTEVPVATIKKDQDGKGPLARRLLLHEVPTGEVKVRLDLQLYDQTPHP